MNLEIKDKNHSIATDKIIELIFKHDVISQMAISSFNHLYFNEIKNRKELEKVEFGFLYDTTEDKKVDFKLDINNHTINVWYKEVTPEFVHNAHSKNMGVHVWFCMNDEESDEIINHLLKCEVDIICSNHPSNVFKLREEFENVNVAN